MTFKINLRFLMLIAILFIAGFAINACTTIPLPAKTPAGLSTWFSDNWPVLLLVLSETLAILPGKYSGILKSIIEIILNSRKKKSSVTVH